MKHGCSFRADVWLHAETHAGLQMNSYVRACTHMCTKSRILILLMPPFNHRMAFGDHTAAC